MDTELQPGICEKCKKQTVVQLRQSDELLCHDCYKEHKKQAESSEKEKDASPLGENKMADDEDEKDKSNEVDPDCEISDDDMLNETLDLGSEASLSNLDEPESSCNEQQDSNMARVDQEKPQFTDFSQSQNPPQVGSSTADSNLLNKSSVNRLIFTDLVRNIRIKTTKTNRKQYQWLGTLAELKDFSVLLWKGRASGLNRQLKGTRNSKKPKYVHTFSASFEDLKTVWYANGTLQFQGKSAEDVKTDIYQLLGEKISADIKDNDIPLRVNELPEDIKGIWEAISNMRKDMSYIRKLNITRSAELNSGNDSDDFINVDCNQKRITDYFNRISKAENLDSIERRSQKKKLEYLEKRLREMEDVQKRLLKENSRLRDEKRTVSKKNTATTTTTTTSKKTDRSKSQENSKEMEVKNKKKGTNPIGKMKQDSSTEGKKDLRDKNPMPALQTKKNTASKPVKDKVKNSERPRSTDIAGNEKIKSKNRSDEIYLTGLESERGHPSTSKTKSSIFIAGDSVVKDVRGWLLSRHKYVKVYSFSGADTTDMNDFIKPLLKRRPDEVILHIGTNNLASTLSPEQIVDEILKLRLIITSYSIKCTISTIVRRDDGFWQKACEVNQLL